MAKGDTFNLTEGDEFELTFQLNFKRAEVQKRTDAAKLTHHSKAGGQGRQARRFRGAGRRRALQAQDRPGQEGDLSRGWVIRYSDCRGLPRPPLAPVLPQRLLSP